jgi:hypothetical protein
MIYLIITTSINNRYGVQDQTERQERYLYAITETLKNLPNEIKPIIVENNGKRATYLDNFYHHHRQHVKVFYTNNNKLEYRSKGVNEMLDIKEIIEKYGIEDDDIIIKLTGRYRALSSTFFKEIIKNEKKFDVFVKFYGVCSLQFEEYDCVLGCYAMRANLIRIFNHLSFDNNKPAETIFARYARFCGGRLKEIENIDIECSFADTHKVLIV